MDNERKIKVILADDHAVLREGISRYIEKKSDNIEVVGEAADWHELIQLLRSKTRADVALLDITMPGGDGLNSVKNIRAEFPDLKIIMLSGLPEGEYAPRFLKAGASGYISKVDSLKTIIPAIKDVAKGGIAISQDLKQRLALDKLQIGKKPFALEALTDREFQVLVQLGSGKSPSEVAKLLHLSSKTISTHRNSIMRKMDWKHNGEMIFYAIKKGLVTK